MCFHERYLLEPIEPVQIRALQPKPEKPSVNTNVLSVIRGFKIQGSAETLVVTGSRFPSKLHWKSKGLQQNSGVH